MFRIAKHGVCRGAVTRVPAAWFTEGWSPDGAGAVVEAVNVKAV